jgi:uncharacterized metal-binding protein YceD (DUF177 family)
MYNTIHHINTDQSTEHQEDDLQRVLYIAKIGDRILFAGQSQQKWYNVCQKNGKKVLKPYYIHRDEIRFY